MSLEILLSVKTDEIGRNVAVSVTPMALADSLTSHCVNTTLVTAAAARIHERRWAMFAASCSSEAQINLFKSLHLLCSAISRPPKRAVTTINRA
jgi:hypothetical protein